MKTALVTGGSGYLGSLMVKKLLDNGWRVKSIDINPPFNQKNKFDFFKADVRNLNNQSNIFKNVDCVFHNVALVPISKTKDFYSTNTLGTKNVMQACKENKVRKIIHFSTDEIYGEIFKGSFNENDRFNPSNPYSSSKAAAEMIVNGYIHSYKLPVIIVRANNIFGTRQHPEKLISGCCWSFIKNKELVL